MWRRRIMESNRGRATEALKKKLFLLDEHLGGVLMDHRKICQEMVKDNYFVDLSKGTEIKTLNEFS